MTTAVLAASIAVVCARTCAAAAVAQSPGHEQEINVGQNFSISTTGTQRFVAAHGQRAVIMGYAGQGLEVWAYPFQILSNYRIGFRPEGSTGETDASPLLHRLIYTPDSVTRIYAGPDYVIRERLFVPLDQPAAVLSYEVDAQHPVDIVVHFTPVLNLMWPGALGGQSTEWDAAAAGYVITEPANGLSALVGSAQTVSHDSTVNTTVAANELSFAVRPRLSSGGRVEKSWLASVYVGMRPGTSKEASSTIPFSSSQMRKLESESDAHYESLANTALRIRTPDDEVNSALAWAEVALDQAWVCDPRLGCGTVAGYGPSRAARRPQYDWFFGGDGLVATNALLSASEYARARDELAFIIRYQDPKSGMIWHELSQSAGYIDWSKYIYMFVHADITFDYLTTMARYLQVSGDQEFVRAHWASILAAYQYCRSLVNPDDHYPHIPPGKEGGDEQHRPADDLPLSVSWVTASEGFAELARASGQADQAEAAEREARLARTSIARQYWDARQNFWIDGHTADGAPIFTRRSGPGEAIVERIFSPAESGHVLDEIASSKFRTDWGVRGVSTDSTIYDPSAYSVASTSALNSADTAALFWEEHRPEVAESIWRGVLAWNTLDSPGHLHELLAGDYYHPQAESVPEQTWSSAGLLDATVQGLFGLTVNGEANRVLLRPHLPAAWHEVSLDNVVLPNSRLGFTIHQDTSGVDLEVRNSGPAVSITFAPQIALGARLTGYECQDGKAKPRVEIFSDDEHASVQLLAHTGTSHCSIHVEGGVSLIVPHTAPQYGDPSSELKLTGVSLKDGRLLIDADVSGAGANRLRVQTPWKLVSVQGAKSYPVSGEITEIEIERPAALKADRKYQTAHAEITFQGR